MAKLLWTAKLKKTFLKNLNQLKLLWTEKLKETVKNVNQLFRISVVVPLNFIDIFAATDTGTYFHQIPMEIFMKKIFF